MARSVEIRIGENIIESTKQEIQFLKSILDSLELPYILDGVSFHNTLLDLHRLKSIHGTDVWKVEKDGSVNLSNRFGHSGCFDYEYLQMPSLIEFQFVDLSLLSEEEAEFLGYIIFEADTIPALSANAGQ
jgi:hypothetical protein